MSTILSDEQAITSSVDVNFESRVIVKLGNLFNQKSELLIIPRSAQGTLGDSFKEGIEALNPVYLPNAKSTSKLGALVFEENSQNAATKIAYATSVNTNRSSETAIQKLGKEIVELATQKEIKSVTMPLLGTGRGNLNPNKVFSILEKIGSEAPATITFTIVINNVELYEALSGRPLSATVRQMVKNLVNRSTCTAADLVADILSRHDDYGNNSGATARLNLVNKPSSSVDQPLNEWIIGLLQLFDSKTVPVLYGRVVIAGLCVMDEVLRLQLIKNDFLKTMISEVEESLGTLFSIDELRNYQRKYPATIKIPFVNEAFLLETVNTNINKMLNNDTWATKDLLGYELYATVISKMIIEDKNQTSPPLTVAVLAPWGQGKTTLMRYIEKDIKSKRMELRDALREAILNEKAGRTEPEQTELDELVENRLNEKRQQKFELEKEEDGELKAIAERKRGRALTIAKEQARSKTFAAKFRVFTSKSKNKFDQVSGTIRNLLDWLKEAPADSTPIPFPTVWFNPWKHQNSEQVWAGMALSIINQLVDYLPGPEKEKFWFQLNLKRVNSNAIKNRIYQNIVNEFLTSLSLGFVFVSFFVFAGFVALGWWLVSVISFGDFGGLIKTGFSVTGVVLPAFYKFLESRRTVLNESLEKSFADIVTEPKYETRVGYFQEVETDLERVFSLLVSTKAPAVIFIDDLDRCSPDVTAEVIEAINQIINGSYSVKCYFVIGMDAKMVAASLDKKYSSLAEKLRDEKNRFGDIGYYFLDKFIQLPFVLPVLDDEARLTLLTNLFSSNEPDTLTGVSRISEEKKELAALPKDSTGEVSQQKVVELVKQGNQEAEKVFLANQVSKTLIDSPEIIEQIKAYGRYLGTSPRVLKRFVNMFRFYYSYQELRKTKNKKYAPASVLAKWLLLSVRCPQLVRFIQRERADNFVLSADPMVKAKRFDALVNDFNKKHLKAKTESLEPAVIQAWRENVDNLKVQDFDWLKEEDVLNILLKHLDKEGSLENAIACNVW